MPRYLIVTEPTAPGFSAYSPDLLACVATGSSRTDVDRGMRDAIEFHPDGLRADRHPIPPGSTSATYVEGAA